MSPGVAVARPLLAMLKAISKRPSHQKEGTWNLAPADQLPGKGPPDADDLGRFLHGVGESIGRLLTATCDIPRHHLPRCGLSKSAQDATRARWTSYSRYRVTRSSANKPRTPITKKPPPKKPPKQRQ